jgi:hypothetical protein
MDLRPFVESLRQQLLVAAAAGGEDARALAEQLTAPLEAATRLTLLSALTTAADEITRDLAPGSVEVRLRGLDPSFAVTAAPGDGVAPPVAEMTPVQEEGPAARINFRPPERLKNRIDEAAARDGMSVNAWLIRVVTSALGTDRTTGAPGASGDRHHVGWVR